MKKTIGLLTILFSSLAVARCQTTFTAPISLNINCDISDGYANGQPQSSEAYGPAISISYDSINETAYYDPNTDTLRQVGTISTIGNTQFSLSFQDEDYLNSTFGTVTVNLTIPSQISFDTGVQSGGFEYSIPIPVTGSCSLTTDGQIYTSDFSASLPSAQIDCNISQNSQNSPYSYNLSSGSFSHYILPQLALTQIAASNGFDLNLIAGFEHVSPEGYYTSDWSGMNPVTINSVPEPNSLLVFGFGFFGLTICQKIRRKSNGASGRT